MNLKLHKIGEMLARKQLAPPQDGKNRFREHIANLVKS